MCQAALPQVPQNLLQISPQPHSGVPASLEGHAVVWEEMTRVHLSSWGSPTHPHLWSLYSCLYSNLSMVVLK